MKKKLEKHELQIPKEWTVVKNEFYQINLDEYLLRSSSEEQTFYELIEDIAQFTHELKNQKMTIDLGWYPEEDPNGEYVLLLIENTDWDNPIKQFKSKNNESIAKEINLWLSKH